MNPKYLPKTPEGRLDHLVEEIGEVLQAIGKLRRFGPYNHHHPERQNLPNWRQLQTEIRDLYRAASLVDNDLYEQFGPPPTTYPPGLNNPPEKD